MHIDDIPTHYEPPTLQDRYLNAEQAARKWCDLHDHIAGVPGFDYQRPLIDISTSSGDGHINRLIDQKRALDRAFLAVGRRPRPGFDKWCVWVKVRLHGVLTVDFEQSEARVRQVRDRVDIFIDRELDRRGLLLSESARAKVEKLRSISSKRQNSS